ncbi:MULTISPECIES: ISAzo13-like element transposase-related protein [unclassified Microcoleus]|uniref:ISAzo13-like element transposase-related protein n=1 Tax=unclassified Microcoleus TaxID=2642155 RepID=UPI00403F7D1F
MQQLKPIEHQLFIPISRACQGGFFTSLELVKSVVKKSLTQTELSVAVNILNIVYQTCINVADYFKILCKLFVMNICPNGIIEPYST